MGQTPRDGHNHKPKIYENNYGSAFYAKTYLAVLKIERNQEWKNYFEQKHFLKNMFAVNKDNKSSIKAIKFDVREKRYTERFKENTAKTEVFRTII